MYILECRDMRTGSLVRWKFKIMEEEEDELGVILNTLDIA